MPRAEFSSVGLHVEWPLGLFRSVSHPSLLCWRGRICWPFVSYVYGARAKSGKNAVVVAKCLIKGVGFF